jgi:hypothetical protein
MSAAFAVWRCASADEAPAGGLFVDVFRQSARRRRALLAGTASVPD